MNRSRKKYQYRLMSLVLVHLLIFVYPLVSKAVHTHERAIVHYEGSAGSATLTHQEEHCPVCDFLFCSFVCAQKQPVTAIPAVVKAHPSPELAVVHTPLLNYFSSRAP